MKRILAILLLALPMMTGFSGIPAIENQCDCPSVTQLTRTGKTLNSISWAWSYSSEASAFEVWYHREEDNYTSGIFTTGNQAYTFTSLPPGHYTFYIRAVCGLESSGFIGAEDVIEN